MLIRTLHNHHGVGLFFVLVIAWLKSLLRHKLPAVTDVDGAGNCGRNHVTVEIVDDTLFVAYGSPYIFNLTEIFELPFVKNEIVIIKAFRKHWKH